MYDDIDTTDGSLGVPPRSDDRLERWLSDLVENGWNLLALDGERVVGHVGIAPADADQPHLVIFVHPADQNRGIGTELLKHLIAYAADRSYDALALSVAADNDSMRSVASNLSFDVTERLPIEYTMKLPLDDPITERVQRPPLERD
jgi:RimJ/RimL family protein N-acetyltransferase